MSTPLIKLNGGWHLKQNWNSGGRGRGSPLARAFAGSKPHIQCRSPSPTSAGTIQALLWSGPNPRRRETNRRLGVSGAACLMLPSRHTGKQPNILLCAHRPQPSSEPRPSSWLKQLSLEIAGAYSTRLICTGQGTPRSHLKLKGPNGSEKWQNVPSLASYCCTGYQHRHSGQTQPQEFGDGSPRVGPRQLAIDDVDEPDKKVF